MLGPGDVVASTSLVERTSTKLFSSLQPDTVLHVACWPNHGAWLGWTGRYENALQQNDIINVYEEDFAGLGEGDGAEVGAAGKAAALKEVQTFTDLTRSKGRAISAIHWHPTRKVMHPRVWHRLVLSQ